MRPAAIVRRTAFHFHCYDETCHYQQRIWCVEYHINPDSKDGTDKNVSDQEYNT